MNDIAKKLWANKPLLIVILIVVGVIVFTIAHNQGLVIAPGGQQATAGGAGYNPQGPGHNVPPPHKHKHHHHGHN